MPQNMLIIGSRGSDLALWQAHFAQEQLKQFKVDSEIKIIKTQGDKIQHLSFDKMEGKGFFTKEIEAALMDSSVDLAVHSHKDLETNSPEGLHIAAVSYRANPRDVLLIREEAMDDNEPFSLKRNAIVGTSSARRKAQILHLRYDVKLKDIRGNVPTRIEKLKSGDFDAILLAAAGIERIKPDLKGLIKMELDPTVFVPAPAQGVLAFQVRSNDKESFDIVHKMNDSKVAQCIKIEREILKTLEGGCQMPLGAYCEEANGVFTIHVSYAQAWDSEVYQFVFETDEPEGMGAFIAEQIKSEL